MKSALLMIPLAALLVATGAHAQKSQIFRCGNAYTNDAAEAKAKGCKLVEGGNVTVVEGTKVSNTPAGGTRVAAAKPAAGPITSDADQKARDADARAILDAELKKAEARQAELLKEYNNGEPEKLGPEHKNHQKYLDRVAALKESISRNEQDIAGLKRELSRVGGTVPASK
jgi:hypothetical protein